MDMPARSGGGGDELYEMTWTIIYVIVYGIIVLKKTLKKKFRSRKYFEEFQGSIASENGIICNIEIPSVNGL